jgi:hypothetical protein
MKITSYKDIENALAKTEKDFIDYYLDYWNDFLTIGGYARYYGITENKAAKRISIGRKMFNAPKYKHVWGA